MITIEVGACKKLSGEESLFVSFPYNIELVQKVKSLPTRYYHADTHSWEVPIKKLQDLVELFAAYPITLKGTVKEKQLPILELPKGFSFKTNPFAHQRDGFYYGLEHNAWLLGDEQGLGKTKQVIDIAVAHKLARGYKHCLIVCGVNGLKWNWYNEVRTHSNEHAHIIGSYTRNGKTQIGSIADRLLDLKQEHQAYFLITNVETIRDERIAAQLAKMCKSGEIGIVAIDEIHKCKNPSTQQGKAIMKLKSAVRIAMTGTPLMNHPLDLFIILAWLGYEQHSFYQFKAHYSVFGGYGGRDVIGYKNLDQLREQLDDVMLRRLKKDVLDLPEKVYMTEVVEMGTKQAKIYGEVKQALKANIDQIKLNPNPLAMLTRLRQATGYTGILSSTIQESAKLDRLEELMEDIVEAGGKAIVFSNFTDITTPAYDRLRKYNPAIITGEVKDRQFQEKKFQTDDTCKVIIGTIGAMGTGLTLTAANNVIFLDDPWNRANKEQAEDRAHRIGTKWSVNIITLVCKDTIDERIANLIYKKGQMADLLVDGIASKQDKSQMIDWLLED